MKLKEDVIYSFSMSKLMNQKLKESADENQRTLAGQIRLILEEWLEKNK